MDNNSVIAYGRKDIGEFFNLGPLSDLRFGRDINLNQTPLLLFLIKDDKVIIRVEYRPLRVIRDLDIPDSTKVMSQWPGMWRSDFFQYCVGDLRQAFPRK